MPGELGDEQEQQPVGYYEHRYVPTGDWMLDSVGAINSWKDERKYKKPMIRRILERLRKQREEEDAKSK